MDDLETRPARSSSEHAALLALTDALPVLVAFVDRERRYQFANSIYETWFGLSRESLRGKLVREVIGEAAYALIEDRMTRALAGERLSFEQFMPYTATRARHIQVEYIPRIEPDGVVSGFYTLVQDVTEAKQAAAALQAAAAASRADAERVSLALKAGAIVGTWVWDVTNDHFQADPQFAATFGLDPELCRQGLPLERVMGSIHPEDLATVSAAIEEAMGRGGPYRCEYRVLRADGLWRWIEANGQVELDARGAAVRFPGVLLDIEERRATQQALVQANNLLRTFMSAVPGVIYAKDLDGRLLVGNRGVEQLLGRSNEDFVGRTDMELLEDKDEAGRVAANDQRIMTSGVAEQVEEQVTYPDGTEAWWHSTKAPLRDDTGQVIGLVGSSVDITERRRAEEHRQLLVNELNHRVKNTLAVVQGLARQTFRKTADPAAALAAFDDRLTALSRAHNVLTDINWSAADLREILESQVGRSRRVRLEGPRVALPPQQAVNLALALHELNTNATKYGALSNEAGQVDVAWRVAADSRRLRLDWRESGGPAVVAPTRRGFGSSMIERALSHEAGGEVEIGYMETGVECRIELDLPLAAE